MSLPGEKNGTFLMALVAVGTTIVAGIALWELSAVTQLQRSLDVAQNKIETNAARIAENNSTFVATRDMRNKQYDEIVIQVAQLDRRLDALEDKVAKLSLQVEILLGEKFPVNSHRQR